MFIEPVIDNEFYGRKNVLELLYKRINSLKEGFRQNLAILGTELSGKTSLIFQFIRHFNEPKILMVYVEVKIETFVSFAYRFMTALLYYYLKRVGVGDLEYNFEFLRSKGMELIPETLSSINKIEEYIKNRKNIEQIYSLLLELPFVLHKETGILIVIIIDEFHFLEDLQIRHPFVKLGKEIMAQKSIMYILISSRVNKAKFILSEKLSLLFGKFEIIFLELFTLTETMDFLNKKLHPYKIPDKYSTFLTWITDGSPFYLDLFASELKNYSAFSSTKIITQEQIQQVFKSLLFNSKSFLFQYFYSKLKNLYKSKDKTIFMSLLFTLSSKNSSLKDIKDSSGSSHRKDMLKYLTKLIELNVISKHSNFYNLTDRLFKIWLELVYKNKLLSLYISDKSEKQIEKFNQEFSNTMNLFQQELKRDAFDKIISLFQSFQNETIAFNSRRKILPRFDTVETGMVGKLGPYLLAHKNNTTWICAIKKGRVDPEDILEFDKACKRTRRNIKRKIFIIIGTLDSNVQLLAKERKLWVLELNQLNFLFDLYNQTPIFQ